MALISSNYIIFNHEWTYKLDGITENKKLVSYQITETEKQKKYLLYVLWEDRYVGRNQNQYRRLNILETHLA